MLEIYLITTLLSFIIMNILNRYIDKELRVGDILLNLIASTLPIFNVVVLVAMSITIISEMDCVHNILNKKVF